MKLLNGPYNGREIEDCGAAQYRLAITEDGTERSGVKLGVAIYDPSESRELAFWSHNEWDGTLMEVIQP